MRILIFHGYLLRGTGSNIYNVNLAQALARLGHDVHLLCQDRDAAELPWVDAIGRWPGGELELEQLRPFEGPGSVTAYVPEIGGLLPVYVHDRYPGFEVKTFPDLSEAELDRYLDSNVRAVADVVEAAGGVDAALANHLIMGPSILARAGLRFAAKIHGSDLSYTVRPHPERFVPYGREGMEAASAALVGSGYTAQDLWRTLELEGLEQRTRLGPPGVDIAAFRPRPRGEATVAVAALAERVASAPAAGLGRDPAEAARSLRWFAEGDGPRALYVGKLLVNKGVDLLLAAWPLVVAEQPSARLLVGGFGAFRGGLERLWASLESGDLDEARELAVAGRELEGEGAEGGLRILSAFLATPPAGYSEAARAASGSVAWSGRLEHDEVAELMPAADAFVMPSTLPEAFGMVAAEAAACGVPPLSADHSGMREVSARLAEAIGPELAPLLSFEVAEGAPAAIAERLGAWMALERGEREQVGAALAGRVAELWSWEGVARGVIAASRGELEGLSPVPQA